MHKLSIELIEKLSDILQTGDSASNHKVIIFRQNKDKGYENFPFVIPEVTRISVDRRWSMAADEMEIEMANINGYYSPDYSPSKQYKNVNSLPLSGYKDVIHAYNKITCDLGYGGELIRMFTGQLQNIDIVESPPSIKFNSLNEYRKLLKPVDPKNKKKLLYENETVFNIVKDLCSMAGIDELLFDNESVNGQDFTIEKVKFTIGMDYSEAIKKLLSIMNHRITGGRYGGLQILKNEIYTQRDFHNWDFDDFVNLSEGTYKIDTSVIRNRVIIQSDNGWQAFEDPFLVDYCNGEIISSGLEVPWAETIEQKWAVADNYFLTMRRKLRRITVAVCGNPAMDIGDLVKMRMLTSTANSKYMIVAIQSDYSEKGYIDQVDLEYVGAADTHLCEPAEGDYADDPDDTDDAAPVVMTLRDKIVDYAKSFLGIYYQWGGNYPDAGYGLDCSHFTYQVLKKFNLIDSYKEAAVQRNWCKPITRDELLPGDLVFYTGKTGAVKHVVMYIGNSQIIGANGGGSNTTTIGIAKSKKAMVKPDRINYRPPAFFGRPPGLEG